MCIFYGVLLGSKYTYKHRPGANGYGKRHHTLPASQIYTAITGVT